jgi:DNA-directed RNA polymerase specialized sigma24 family protein
VNPDGFVIESSVRCGRGPSSAPYARSWPVALANRGQAEVRRPRTDLAWRPQRQAAIVRDAVAQLSDPQRAMIYRSHYLGRTTTQIAAELGTNGDVVKYELHHALHALRMTLQSAGDGR